MSRPRSTPSRPRIDPRPLLDRPSAHTGGEVAPDPSPRCALTRPWDRCRSSLDRGGLHEAAAGRTQMSRCRARCYIRRAFRVRRAPTGPRRHHPELLSTGLRRRARKRARARMCAPTARAPTVRRHVVGSDLTDVWGVGAGRGETGCKVGCIWELYSGEAPIPRCALGCVWSCRLRDVQKRRRDLFNVW